MYIPYTWLSGSLQKVVVCSGIPVYFHLPSPGARDCIISLSRSHTFPSGSSVSVPVGTVFELEYKEIVSEIHLGRWLLMCDA
jgi:hypothetical protein